MTLCLRSCGSKFQIGVQSKRRREYHESVCNVHMSVDALVSRHTYTWTLLLLLFQYSASVWTRRTSAWKDLLDSTQCAMNAVSFLSVRPPAAPSSPVVQVCNTMLLWGSATSRKWPNVGECVALLLTVSVNVWVLSVLHVSVGACVFHYLCRWVDGSSITHVVECRSGSCQHCTCRWVSESFEIWVQIVVREELLWDE